MPVLDVVDDTYIVAGPRRLRELLCDESTWHRLFPGLRLECFDDRGDLGKRWSVAGALVGTCEIWLEALEDGDEGTVVHSFVQADPVRQPAPGSRAHRRLRRRLERDYAVPLKRRITAVKDHVERGRDAGERPRNRTVPSRGSLGPDQRPRAAAASPTRSPAMADQTTSDIVIEADRAPIMATIADFKSYPAWATGVQETEVLSTGVDGRAEEVRFVLDASPIRDEYALRYEWNDDTDVTWTLSQEGKMLRGMDGSYVLRAEGQGRTRVTYRLAVDVSIPLLGMLRRKAEKVIIDTALKGLKARVEEAG